MDDLERRIRAIMAQAPERPTTAHVHIWDDGSFGLTVIHATQDGLPRFIQAKGASIAEVVTNAEAAGWHASLPYACPDCPP